MMFIIGWLGRILAVVFLLSPKGKAIREALANLFWQGVKLVVRYNEKDKG